MPIQAAIQSPRQSGLPEKRGKLRPNFLRFAMATYTPPPYFPQGSLNPPDKNRYRKFKLMMAGGVILLLAVVVGAIVGIVYLVKWLL